MKKQSKRKAFEASYEGPYLFVGYSHTLVGHVTNR
jgi:hypothetical protein